MSGRIDAARRSLTVETGTGATRIALSGALILGMAIAYLAMVFLFWSGPLGGDDAQYWAAASEWLRHIPYIGHIHFAMRHTLVIPLVVSRLVLGDGMPALVLSTMAATFALIVVLVLWVRRVADIRAAIFAALLLVTNPLLILLSSTASIDHVEAFFVFAAFALFARALDKGPSWRTLMSVGALAGLAVMSRETSTFALAAMGVLFLAGYGMERRWYLVIGLGFAAVIGAEMSFYWVFTGNPFYRYIITFHHDELISRWVEQGAGTPIVHPLIDPLIMLLLSHYFGTMFWIGLPLAVWLVCRVTLTGPARQLVIVLGVLSLVWAVIAAALWQQLTLVPRYYLVSALCVTALAALAMSSLWQRGQARLAVACAALLFIGNLYGLAGDNRNYMFGERVLVGLAANSPVVIHTDPETLRRTDPRLEFAGAKDRVVDTAPKPGELYFYNPTRAEHGFQPGKDWVVVGRRAPPVPLVLRLLQQLPEISLPSWLLNKLGAGHPGVTLYRVA